MEAEAKATVIITDDMTEEQKMAALGFPMDFTTTKGKKVDDKACNMSHARLRTKRTYRQYMNRPGIVMVMWGSQAFADSVFFQILLPGGFNRPLDSSH